MSRWGGEEFLHILESTNKEGAYCLAEKIHNHLRASPMSIDNKELYLTVSIGIKEVLMSETFDMAIKAADDNLYKAKSNGKNQTFF